MELEVRSWKPGVGETKAEGGLYKPGRRGEINPYETPPIHFALCIAAMALLAGCSGKSDSTAQGTNSVNVATNGFGGYVKQMAAEQKTAYKTIDLTSLNQAIQLFNIQEGRYPRTCRSWCRISCPKSPGRLRL